MAEPILPWVGFAVLLLLCLPLRSVQRFVLAITSWALRLALILLLLAGAYLTFQPGDLPREVAAVVADFPGVLGWLPPIGSPAFGLSLACALVAPLVPLLAGIDCVRRTARLTQQLFSQEVKEDRPVSPPPVAATPGGAPPPGSSPDEPLEAIPQAQEIEEPLPVGVPLLRPIERREAAGALAAAARRPGRPAT